MKKRSTCKFIDFKMNSWIAHLIFHLWLSFANGYLQDEVIDVYNTESSLTETDEPSHRVLPRNEIFQAPFYENDISFIYNDGNESDDYAFFPPKSTLRRKRKLPHRKRHKKLHTSQNIIKLHRKKKEKTVPGRQRDEIPEKHKKLPKRTFYPPPSEMGSIRKNLSDTEESLRESGKLGVMEVVEDILAPKSYEGNNEKESMVQMKGDFEPIETSSPKLSRFYQQPYLYHAPTQSLFSTRNLNSHELQDEIENSAMFNKMHRGPLQSQENSKVYHEKIEELKAQVNELKKGADSNKVEEVHITQGGTHTVNGQEQPRPNNEETSNAPTSNSGQGNNENKDQLPAVERKLLQKMLASEHGDHKMNEKEFASNFREHVWKLLNEESGTSSANSERQDEPAVAENVQNPVVFIQSQQNSKEPVATQNKQKSDDPEYHSLGDTRIVSKQNLSEFEQIASGLKHLGGVKSYKQLLTDHIKEHLEPINPNNAESKSKYLAEEAAHSSKKPKDSPVVYPSPTFKELIRLQQKADEENEKSFAKMRPESKLDHPTKYKAGFAEVSTQSSAHESLEADGKAQKYPEKSQVAISAMKPEKIHNNFHQAANSRHTEQRNDDRFEKERKEQIRLFHLALEKSEKLHRPSIFQTSQQTNAYDANRKGGQSDQENVPPSVSYDPTAFATTPEQNNFSQTAPVEMPTTSSQSFSSNDVQSVPDNTQGFLQGQTSTPGQINTQTAQNVPQAAQEGQENVPAQPTSTEQVAQYAPPIVQSPPGQASQTNQGNTPDQPVSSQSGESKTADYSGSPESSQAYIASSSSRSSQADTELTLKPGEVAEIMPTIDAQGTNNAPGQESVGTSDSKEIQMPDTVVPSNIGVTNQPEVASSNLVNADTANPDNSHQVESAKEGDSLMQPNKEENTVASAAVSQSAQTINANTQAPVYTADENEWPAGVNPGALFSYQMKSLDSTAHENGLSRANIHSVTSQEHMKQFAAEQIPRGISSQSNSKAHSKASSKASSSSTSSSNSNSVQQNGMKSKTQTGAITRHHGKNPTSSSGYGSGSGYGFGKQSWGWGGGGGWSGSPPPSGMPNPGYPATAPPSIPVLQDANNGGQTQGNNPGQGSASHTPPGHNPPISTQNHQSSVASGPNSVPPSYSKLKKPHIINKTNNKLNEKFNRKHPKHQNKILKGNTVKITKQKTMVKIHKQKRLKPHAKVMTKQRLLPLKR